MSVPRDGLRRDEAGGPRCWWVGGDDLYRRYHDQEWGRPVTDDRRLFEKVCLEGFQAGLSWITILRKRDAFRRGFAGFDFAKVARFGRREVARLLRDEGIVRHRGKIESTINNARRALDLIEECGSLAAFFWRYEPPPSSRPARMTLAALRRLTESQHSRALGKDLRSRGWTFVGATTLYAFMQAVGLVNDHLEGCAIRAPVEALRARLKRPR